MNKFFTYFFVTLGVIFSLILLFVVYFFIVDPFNIRPFIFGGEKINTKQDVNVEKNTNTNTSTSTGTTSSKPFLTDDQKKTLAGFGVDPASLPSSITPTQEACFKTKLGPSRFAEISAGASPSIAEFLNAKSCL